jgi:hypothetical protein
LWLLRALASKIFPSRAVVVFAYPLLLFVVVLAADVFGVPSAPATKGIAKTTSHPTSRPTSPPTIFLIGPPTNPSTSLPTNAPTSLPTNAPTSPPCIVLYATSFRFSSYGGIQTRTDTVSFDLPLYYNLTYAEYLVGAIGQLYPQDGRLTGFITSYTFGTSNANLGTFLLRFYATNSQISGTIFHRTILVAW